MRFLFTAFLFDCSFQYLILNITFRISGIPEWARHHWVPDRPTSVRFQALPQHRPNQHSRQVKIRICIVEVVDIEGR